MDGPLPCADVRRVASSLHGYTERKKAPPAKRGRSGARVAAMQAPTYAAAAAAASAAPHAAREAAAAAEATRAATAEAAAAQAVDAALTAARRVLDEDATLASADAMDALVARHGQARPCAFVRAPASRPLR